MFKIKFKSEDKSKIEQKLNLIETEQYQFVLTDDVKLIEQDKVNLIFTMEQIDLIDRHIQWNYLKTDKIKGKSSRGDVLVKLDDIEVLSAYGNEIYTYLNKNRIDFSMKLYQLEQILASKGFIRVSKSDLVNVHKIDSISSAFNGKLNLILKSGEKVEVNRSYKKRFVEKIEGETL